MKTFVLFGKEIEIDNNIMTYSNFYKSYVRDAAEEMAKFENFLDNECEDIRDVVIYGTKICKNEIDYLVDRAINTLVANDIYDVDSSTYLERYGRKYLNWNFLKKWEKICKDIDQNYNARLASAQRTAEYNSVSSMHVSGGGFGLRGAAKGIVTASIINGLSDRAARKSAERQLRRDVQELEQSYNRQISSVYNQDTKRELLSDFFDMFMGGFYAILDELEYQDLFEYPDFDMAKAEVIAKNTEKFAQDKKKYIDNYVQCIILDPFEEDYYIALYMRDDISDEDALTLDEMVHTLTRATIFDAKTEKVRSKRAKKRILEQTERCVKLDIAGKAEILYDILEKKRRESDLYTKDLEEKIDKVFSDELLVIKNTVDKETSGKGLDDKQVVEAYCDQKGIKKEDGGKISAMYLYASIFAKHPFFRVCDNNKLVLDNYEDFNDFLDRLDVIQNETTLSLEHLMPEALKLRIEEKLAKMWDGLNSVEDLDLFINLNNRYAGTFKKPVIAKKKYSNRRTELEKQTELNNYFKSTYGQYALQPDNVNLETMIALAKDRNKMIPKGDVNVLSEDYLRMFLKEYSKDFQQRNEMELLKLAKDLKKVHDPLSAEIREKVEKCYNDKIASFAPVSLVTYDGDKYGLKIYCDLKEKKVVRKSTQIGEKLLSQFKDLGSGYHFIGREEKWTFYEGVEVALKNYAQDIKSAYDVIIVEDINPRTASARCEKGFVVSMQGVAFKNTYGKGYVKFTSLDGMVIEKDSKGGYVLYALFKGQNAQRKAIACREKHDELEKVVKLFRSILICMYNMPDRNFDETKIADQAKDVENLLQTSNGMNLQELKKVLKKLQNYPDFIAQQARETIQKLYDQKNAELKAEYEELIKDYQNKDVQELEEILSKMEQYPKEFTENDEKTITEFMNKKIVDQHNAEVDELCSGYEQKSIKELEILIKTIKLKYKENLTTKIWSERLQKKYNELQRQEYDAFIAGYQDKSVEELQMILSKLPNYPKEYTQKDEASIRESLDQKIQDKKKAELFECCNGWEQKSKEEIILLVRTIKEQYAEFPEAKILRKRMQERCEQYDLETLEKLTESIETMGVSELKALHAKLSQEFSLKLSAKFLNQINMELETREKEEINNLSQSIMGEEDASNNALNPEKVIAKFKSAGYDLDKGEIQNKMLLVYGAIVSKYIGEQQKRFLMDWLQVFTPNFEFLGLTNQETKTSSGIKVGWNAFKKENDIPIVAVRSVPMVLISQKNVYVYLLGSNECRVYPNTDQFLPYAKTSFWTNDVMVKSDSGYDIFLFTCNSKEQTMAQADALSKLCSFVRNIGRTVATTNNAILQHNEVKAETKTEQSPIPQTIPSGQVSDDIINRIYDESVRLNVNRPSEAFFISKCMTKYDKKIKNAMSKYVNITNDKPLLLYDYTLLESGKEGFVFSDKYFYYNYPGNTGKLELAQIDKFVVEQQKVFIIETNGKKWGVVPVNIDESVASARAEFLNYVLAQLKTDRAGFEPRFCNKCGTPVNPGSLFCRKCGNKLS